jgi:hypothetical protein
MWGSGRSGRRGAAARAAAVDAYPLGDAVLERFRSAHPEVACRTSRSWSPPPVSGSDPRARPGGEPAIPSQADAGLGRDDRTRLGGLPLLFRADARSAGLNAAATWRTAAAGRSATPLARGAVPGSTRRGGVPPAAGEGAARPPRRRLGQIARATRLWCRPGRARAPGHAQARLPRGAGPGCGWVSRRRPSARRRARRPRWPTSPRPPTAPALERHAHDDPAPSLATSIADRHRLGFSGAMRRSPLPVVRRAPATGTERIRVHFSRLGAAPRNIPLEEAPPRSIPALRRPPRRTPSRAWRRPVTSGADTPHACDRPGGAVRTIRFNRRTR